MKTQHHITAVVSAFNEADNIAIVLNALHQSDALGEILVVDDGSTDETTAVVSDWQKKDGRIALKRLKQNQGKGNAMLQGVKAAKYSLILFIDADLKGLRPEHLDKLIAPVQSGAVDMTIAKFENGRLCTSLMHRILPFLSGQRCMYASTFFALFDQENSDWSVETAFNLHAWYYGYRTAYVKWFDVTHAMRPEKRQGLAGYISHLKMWWQIGAYVATFLSRESVTWVKRPFTKAPAPPANKAMPKQSQ